MKYGARNNITAKVTSIKRDKIMALVKFDVTTPTKMASVLTAESAPWFLPLFHRMEERAGERRRVLIAFPSPRSSPRSFLAGRGW